MDDIRYVSFEELQQFVGLGYFFTFQHLTYTHVHFLEILKTDFFLIRLRFPCIEFILFFGIKQTLYLCFDGRIFDFLENVDFFIL